MKTKIVVQCIIGFLIVGSFVGMLIYDYNTNDYRKNVVSNAISNTNTVNKTIKNFTLTDHDNQTFSLNDLKSHYKFVYFGFTSCPDICPISLSKISTVLSNLEKYGYNNFKMLFITVDPNRDKTDIMKEYCKYFHKNIIGLTGIKINIDEVVQDFGAYYQTMEPQSGEDPKNYMVNHTSLVYFVDKNNNYITHFHLQSKPEEIEKYVMQYIKTHK